MEEQSIGIDAETMGQFENALSRVMTGAISQTDKSFEIFKAIAPDLWDKYRHMPNGNFEEALDDAIVFSRKAARAFKSHEFRAKQFQAAFEKQFPGESESD